MITVDDDAENTIVVAPGANGLLTGLTDDDVRVITAADMLVLQLEVPDRDGHCGARKSLRQLAFRCC